MAKKQVAKAKVVDSVSDKEVKDPATGAVMRITNNQRCPWIVPTLLLGNKAYSTSSYVQPMHSVEIDKGRFDHEMKGSKAFRAMVDTGLLLVAKKQVKIDKRDLKSADPVKPPPELGGEGKLEKLEISRQAVTLNVAKNG